MREKVFTMKTIQTMMIQIELHINKWRDTPCSWIGIIILLKVSFLHKGI
jgi:hypothetical protein